LNDGVKITTAILQVKSLAEKHRLDFGDVRCNGLVGDSAQRKMSAAADTETAGNSGC